MSTVLDTPDGAPLADTEASALFNPAFCAVVLYRACAGFTSKADVPMPLTLAYVVLPSALHRPTREALPRTSAASMVAWLRDNPLLLVNLPGRVRAFRDLTSEAIVFGLTHGMLVTDDGSLRGAALRRRPRTLLPTVDWESCMRTAEFLGKWIASSGNDEATTLAQWGLRP